MSTVLTIIGALLARVAALEDELYRTRMRFRQYKEDIDHMRRPK
jgi:hypothetical protein